MAGRGSLTKRIFALWTGDNPMSSARRACLESFPITGLEPTLITSVNVGDWVKPDFPLHPAYQYLSFVHRSDYLRAYLMFHYGGGYADIKYQNGSWLPTVEKVLSSRRLIGAGYREIHGGTPWLQNNLVFGRPYLPSGPTLPITAKLVTNIMRICFRLMIGNGAFYFKPGTKYMWHWLSAVEQRLDALLPLLRENPARDEREQNWHEVGYPVPWSFLMGDINSPLSLLYAARLSRDLPTPSFQHYQ